MGTDADRGLKRSKKVKPATTTDTEKVDARIRRRAIERWENEGGSPAPTDEQKPRPRR